jgi:hypothetical protein
MQLCGYMSPERVCSGVCSNVTKVKPVEMQPPHGRRTSFVVFKHNEVQALFYMLDHVLAVSPGFSGAVAF